MHENVNNHYNGNLSLENINHLIVNDKSKCSLKNHLFMALVKNAYFSVKSQLSRSYWVENSNMENKITHM